MPPRDVACGQHPAMPWAHRTTQPVGAGLHQSEGIVPLSIYDHNSGHCGIFTHLALAYPAPGLEPARFKVALHAALAVFPTLCGRATAELKLHSLHEGASLTVGDSPCTLAELLGDGASGGGGGGSGDGGIIPLPELPSAMFGHLPGVWDECCPVQPLLQVVLVQLADGGSVLGLRTAHLVADWMTIRACLRHLAGCYTAASTGADGSGNGSSGSGAGQQWAGAAVAGDGNAAAAVAAAPAAVPAAAPLDGTALMEQHLDAEQLPDSYTPQRLIMKSAAEAAAIGAALPSVLPTARTVWHVPLHAAAALKEQALASAPPQPCGNGAAGVATAASTISSHDVLLARIWQAVSELPRRRGLDHDLCILMDMRQRLQPPLPADVPGNIFWCALAGQQDATALTLGEAAARVRTCLAE